MLQIIPSKEQNDIIRDIKNGKNVIVNAVAGSGKTTTVLLIAKECPKKKILQITYNKALKLEVVEKAQKFKIKNIEVRTYHSLAVYYYNSKAYTDDYLKEIIENNQIPKQWADFDIIIIDETQDMTYNYFILVNKFIYDMGIDPTLLLLGDVYQSIYEFKNADNKFLKYAKDIWNNKKFEIRDLAISFRLTKNIAHFVNNYMLGENIISTVKEVNQKILYYKGNIFEIYNELTKKITEWIKTNKYVVDDFFILCPSLKNKKIKTFENNLVANGINILYPKSDDDMNLSEDIIKNKIVFSTFHQAKGRERKVVIICNFDDSYFEYYNDSDPKKCSNEIYVAVTRSQEILILIDSQNRNILPFIKKSYFDIQNDNTIKLFGTIPVKLTTSNYRYNENIQTHVTSPSELIKFLSEETINQLHVDQLFDTVVSETHTINIPKEITMDATVEDVSNINAIAISAIFEYQQNNKQITYLDEINKKKHDTFYKSYINLLPSINLYSNGHYLLLANIYLSQRDDLRHKLRQITHYDWLTKEMVDRSINEFKKHVSNNVTFEQYVEYMHNTKKFGDIHIIGRYDIVDYEKEIIWEIKCTTNIQLEHKIQLIIYFWLWKKIKPSLKKTFCILNIATGELIKLKEISPDNDQWVDSIIELLIENKFKKKKELSYEKFVQKCISNVQQFKLNSHNNNHDHKINNKYFFCFDTETNDLYGAIIQFSGFLINAETYELVKIIQLYCKLNKNERITPGAYEKHKIDKTFLEEHGVSKQELTKQLINILDLNIILLVGHNVIYDIKTTIKHLLKTGMPDYARKLKTIPIYCTMENAKTIVNAQTKKNTIKNPSLEETYKFFFQTCDEAKLHNSLYDAYYTWKCYCKLNNILNYFDEKSLLL